MPEQSEKRCRRVMIFAPKGGMGKTTLTANLLVAAAQTGQTVVGVDFDGQKSLMEWFDLREKHDAYSEMVSFSVGDAPLEEWEEVLQQTGDVEYCFFDMPPGVTKTTIEIMAALAPRMDLILIPTLPEAPSYTKVVGFMDEFRRAGLKAYFVINKVVKGRENLRRARDDLQEHGPICAIEITMLKDVLRAAEEGCGIAEIDGAKGADEFRALWKFVKGKTA